MQHSLNRALFFLCVCPWQQKRVQERACLTIAETLYPPSRYFSMAAFSRVLSGCIDVPDLTQDHQMIEYSQSFDDK
jgi:hypothetical protein